MKSPLDNMILKYLEKKSETPAKEQVSGLIKEFKITEAAATDWVEKKFPQHKENVTRLDPRNAYKKNSYRY